MSQLPSIKEPSRVFRSRRFLLFLALLLAGVCGLLWTLGLPPFSVGAADNPQSASPSAGELNMDDLLGITGRTREISEAEYAFFTQMVKRDSANQDEALLRQEVENTINRNNAVFLAAEQLGIAAPFSYETMETNRMEENLRRKEMKEKGETFYGLSQFDSISYYKYMFSNIHLSVLKHIAEHASADMIEEARQYYEENRAVYESVEQVTYQVDKGGEVKEHVITYNELRSLQKTDETLFSFLLSAEKDEQLTYEQLDGEKTVTLLSIVKDSPDFEAVKSTVVKDFVGRVRYDSLIDTIAQNNPVVLQ